MQMHTLLLIVGTLGDYNSGSTGDSFPNHVSKTKEMSMLLTVYQSLPVLSEVTDIGAVAATSP